MFNSWIYKCELRVMRNGCHMPRLSWVHRIGYVYLVLVLGAVLDNVTLYSAKLRNPTQVAVATIDIIVNRCGITRLSQLEL